MGSTANFISSFKQLAIRTKDLTYAFYKECFINDLKEEIRAQVKMQHPATWLATSQKALEAETVITTKIKKTSSIPQSLSPQVNSPSTIPSHPLKVQWLSSVEIAKR